MLTGTVTQVKGLLCRIASTTGTIYFAHRNHFVDPTAMFDGNEVEFREGLAKTGPLPVALDIVAIQRKAA